jgi:hypothetical protein
MLTAIRTAIRYRDGFALEGETEAEMVTNAGAHLREAHAELAELITRDQVLEGVRLAAAATRWNGSDASPRGCPFDIWELSLVYGVR